jgi:hypothetical protein
MEPSNIEYLSSDTQKEASVTDAASELLRSLRYTSASRFNAAKRLEKKDTTITFLITLISIYIVTITLMPYFFRFPPEISGVLNFITVILSIAILVSSLLHRNDNDSIKSEQHHRCALEINELRRELVAHRDTLSLDRFTNFSRQYNAILQKYSVNHDDIDYLRVALERPEDFPWRGPVGRTLLRLRLIASGRLPHLVMLGITAAVVWVIFFYALPARLTATG